MQKDESFFEPADTPEITGEVIARGILGK